MGTSYSKALVISCVAVAAIADHNGGVVSARRPWLAAPRAAFLADNGMTPSRSSLLVDLRGGDSAASSDTTTTATAESDEPSLDEKVYAAMKKLGMSAPDQEDNNGGEECEDGVCAMPESTDATTTTSAQQTSQQKPQMDPNELADNIAKDMNVDARLAMAAIGATSTFGDQNQRIYNEQAARDMIQAELDLISSIPDDSVHVQELVEEGFDPFLSRRALAFAEDNMDDARAILIADQMDEEEDAAAQQQAQEEEDEEAAMRAQLRAERAAKTPDLVEVKSNFDPTALPATPTAKPQPAQQPPNGMPKPAAKASVVFEATTDQIQELVLESPVPVLLDVYADWCGPCKVLGPALEDMAVKSGGMFRLVKINSDNERPIASNALEVTSLPSVFGIRDGKIVNMFKGMPSSEKMMQNFMMGLFGAAPFNPPVTAEESEKYEELTAKLVKTAGAASFSFSQRERLVDRISTKLDDLVQDESTKIDVEGAATLMRTLFNNIVKNPNEQKFRKVNLENKAIQSKLGENASCLGILKSVGFAKSGSELVLAKGKKVINVAPFVVARDCIDKWLLKNRKEMAALARKRKDEVDQARLQAEREAAGEDEEVEEEVVVEEVDPTVCTLKLRLDGKNKVHEVVLHEDDTLSAVLEALGVDADEEATITCVAKRLAMKSTDENAMKKTLREHRLMPAAAIVVKVGAGNAAIDPSSLKDRAAEKKRKKGSHTMQSIGIYAKDDNNKGELVDGGGGTLYEQDVSDDEEEAKAEGDEPAEADADENAEKGEGDEESPDPSIL